MSSVDDDTLESLSTSNRPPSRQESIVAGERLQLSSKELKVLNTQIAALEYELEELKAQRTIIERETHRYADILSPRRLLPPEIIARFMELACMEVESEGLGRYHQIRLSFMRVSREWYRTACGVARFWTELDVDLKDSSAQGVEEVILKATNWITRASELPLSLNIAFSIDPADARIVEFIQSITPRLGLINLRLQVDSVGGFDLEAFYSLFHRPNIPSSRVWPTLHTLQISIQSTNSLVSDFELPFPQANFPLLRTVAISSPNVTLPSYQMPWSNLLKLDLGRLPQLQNQKCISILEQCKNLRFLRIYTQSPISGDSISGILPITLPHLTHLHVRGCNDADTGRLLPLLNLPRLQSCIYTVPDPGMYYPSILERLATLIRCSGCSESMEYLEIDLARGTFYSPNDLRILLLLVPRLVVLKLSGYKMEGPVLQHVPVTVRELSIRLSYHRIDEARTMFVDYLTSRFASPSASLPDDAVKARFHLVETVHTQTARKQLDVLQQQLGSTLDVVMD